MADSNTYTAPVLLPIGEVARRAGVTVPTVRAWERAGKLTSVRTPGNQRRFPEHVVEALLVPDSDSSSVALPPRDGGPHAPATGPQPGGGGTPVLVPAVSGSAGTSPFPAVPTVEVSHGGDSHDAA
jgi:excisionase family DNA binding protein